jgi:hypothetical protein
MKADGRTGLSISQVQGLEQEEFQAESLLGHAYANLVPAPEPAMVVLNIARLLTVGMFGAYRRRFTPGRRRSPFPSRPASSAIAPV